MSDFNPREPIRLSDIDNLLEDSIFTSSNGAKLAEYLRKKRGTTGRVRLQNIFEQVAANIPKPTFNFDLDSSEPNPLPESPQQLAAATSSDAQPERAVSPPLLPTTSSPEPTAGTSTPEQNGIDKAQDRTLSPIVVLHDYVRSPAKQPVKCSDPGVSKLGRQALLNQYHRTNMAKCELLRQITSSTPKPEAVSSQNRISTFATSISPITEVGTPRIPEPDRLVPEVAPPIEEAESAPLALLQVPKVPAVPIDPVLPSQILAPCSQAPAEVSPQKVIVVTEPTPSPPKTVIPETPSPPKSIAQESPKVAHTIVPRQLSVTFNMLQEPQPNESNPNITSDESEPANQEFHMAEEQPLEVEQPAQKEQRLVEEESVEYSPHVEADNLEHLAVSEGDKQEPMALAEQPVTQEEQVVNEENSIVTKSILKDTFSSQKKRHSFRVSFSQQLVQQREISPAPSIPEAHYSSSSDDSSDLSDEDYEDAEFEVLDEVYSDDGAECDPHDIAENYNEIVRQTDELDNRMTELHERPSSPLINVVDEVPVQWYQVRTPRNQPANNDNQLAPATCAKDNKTNLQLVDIITDWDDEEDEEEEAEVERQQQEQQEQQQQQTPVKESQPEPFEVPETQQSANATVHDAMDISSVEDVAERLVELPAPPESFNGTMEPASPSRPITPPSQFTDSAKRRFLRENEDALISRIQNELPPPSQPLPSSPGSPERVSETLMDIVQSFRDQQPPAQVTAASRRTIVPVKKSRGTLAVADPATNSYFKVVSSVKPKPAKPGPAKLVKNKPLTTAQKRKLYATSNGAAKPLELTVSVDSLSVLRNFRIIVQKLRVDTCPEMLTDSDRAVVEKANNKENTETHALQSKSNKKTEDGAAIQRNGQVRQEEDVVKQRAQVESQNQSDNAEPAFAGFDETTDLDQQPISMKNVVHYSAQANNIKDQTPEIAGNEEEEPQPCPEKKPRPKRQLKGKSKPVKRHNAPVAATNNTDRRGRRNLKTTKTKGSDNLPAEKIDEPTTERTDVNSAERLTPVVANDAPTTEKIAQPTNEREHNGHSERLNGAEDHRMASIPEAASAESLEQNSEEDRIIARTPLDAPTTLSAETIKQRPRRPRKPKPDPILLTAAPTRAKQSRKDTVHQPEVLENGTPEEEQQPTPTGSQSSMPSSDNSTNADKQEQLLPFKKRKERIVSADEPPALEPFGEVMPVESNDNVPPVLEQQESAANKPRKKQNRTEYYEKYTTEKSEKQLPRFYHDSDDNDDTWVPNKKSLKNRHNQRLQKGASSLNERESESRRPRRVNTNSRSTDKPNYREMTYDEFMELELMRLAAEKAQKKAAKSKGTKVVASEGRKRVHEGHDEPTSSKRNRSNDTETPNLDVPTQPAVAPTPSAPRNEKSSLQEIAQTFSWLSKLMQNDGVETVGQENTGLIVGGHYLHYSQEHLNCREHNGIQYSFYLHSDTENYGFMRLKPSAVKKRTKTEKFLLKFLVLEGNLSFHLNGQTLQVKGGDFIMLPEHSTYAIENGTGSSLLFMIKLCTSLSES